MRPAARQGTWGDVGDEDYWGGRLALEYRTKRGQLVYGLVSRGYKPGGVNSALLSQLADLEEQGIEVPTENLVFDGESLMNYEIGLKGNALGNRIAFGLSLFYQDRDDMQVKQSIALPLDPSSEGCPCVFIDSLQNAAGGVNQGLEAEFDWLVDERWRLFGSLGLLDTEYRDYMSLAHSEADPDNGVPYDLSGREQAHAPEYQYTAGVQWDFMPGWSAEASVEGKDGFYRIGQPRGADRELHADQRSPGLVFRTLDRCSLGTQPDR